MMNTKPKLYTVCKGETVEELSDEVERMLENGWELYGIPFISEGQDWWTMYQAMVHSED